MQTRDFANILYLVNKIELLLGLKGAIGESLSDKVKSFDNYVKVENPDTGYKFYFDEGDYHIKYDYEDDTNINHELKKYIKYKNQIQEYKIYKSNLLGGYYNNLIRIAHERNQLLHIHAYDIKKLKFFKSACLKAISYLEGTSQSISKPEALPIQDDIEIELYQTQTHLLYKDRCAFAIAEPIIRLFIGLIFSGIVYYYGLTHFNLLDNLSTFRLITAPIVIFLYTVLIYIIYIFLKSVIIFIFRALFEIKSLLFIALTIYIVYIIVFSNSHSFEKKTSENQKCTYYSITTKGLNIRQAPKGSSKVIGTLSKNDNVCITSTFGNWLSIEDNGWIYNKYAKKGN